MHLSESKEFITTLQFSFCKAYLTSNECQIELTRNNSLITHKLTGQDLTSLFNKTVIAFKRDNSYSFCLMKIPVNKYEYRMLTKKLTSFTSINIFSEFINTISPPMFSLQIDSHILPPLHFAAIINSLLKTTYISSSSPLTIYDTLDINSESQQNFNSYYLNRSVDYSLYQPLIQNSFSESYESTNPIDHLNCDSSESINVDIFAHHINSNEDELQDVDIFNHQLNLHSSTSDSDSVSNLHLKNVNTLDHISNQDLDQDTKLKTSKQKSSPFSNRFSILGTLSQSLNFSQLFKIFPKSKPLLHNSPQSLNDTKDYPSINKSYNESDNESNHDNSDNELDNELYNDKSHNESNNDNSDNELDNDDSYNESYNESDNDKSDNELDNDDSYNELDQKSDRYRSDDGLDNNKSDDETDGDQSDDESDDDQSDDDQSDDETDGNQSDSDQSDDETDGDQSDDETDGNQSDDETDGNQSDDNQSDDDQSDDESDNVKYKRLMNESESECEQLINKSKNFDTYSESDNTESDESRSDNVESDESRSDESEVDEVEVDESEVDESESDEVEVNEAESEEAEVDEAESDEVEVNEAERDQISAELQYRLENNDTEINELKEETGIMSELKGVDGKNVEENSSSEEEYDKIRKSWLMNKIKQRVDELKSSTFFDYIKDRSDKYNKLKKKNLGFNYLETYRPKYESSTLESIAEEKYESKKSNLIVLNPLTESEESIWHKI